MTKAIYLDYAASTPIDKKVLEAMMPYLRRYYGNPSSTHSFGQKARVAIEQAREQAAGFLHCKAQEVIFTSGATEANNLAIRGVIKSKIQNPKLGGKPHIVTTAIEHESVLEPCWTLEREGIAEVTYVKPQGDGIVRPEDVAQAIQPNTVLVSIMYANSEIGTIQQIAEIGNLLKSKAQNPKSKILFHTDAVQAANFLDCDVQKLGVDLLTLSGHKIYGPKGVGVLYVREGVRVAPVVEGGGQETGLRSGTENVAAIVGMGQALEALGDPRMAITNIKIRQLRDKLIKAVLRKVPDCELTGSAINRLPNNAHFRFRGVEGRDVVIALDQKGIAVSTGSACSEKTQEPSHVLVALGLEEKESLSALRLTLGKHTRVEDIEKAVRVIAQTVARLRKAIV